MCHQLLGFGLKGKELSCSLWVKLFLLLESQGFFIAKGKSTMTATQRDSILNIRNFNSVSINWTWSTSTDLFLVLYNPMSKKKLFPSCDSVHTVLIFSFHSSSCLSHHVSISQYFLSECVLVHQLSTAKPKTESATWKLSLRASHEEVMTAERETAFRNLTSAIVELVDL